MHISGDTCCINCIFERDMNGKYTKDALLHQNILEYFNIREEKQIEQNIQMVRIEDRTVLRVPFYYMEPHKMVIEEEP